MSISSTIESSTWSQLNFWITQKFNLEVELFYYPKVQPIVFFINSYFTWVELLDNHKVQPMLLGWTLLLSKSSTVLVFFLYIIVLLRLNLPPYIIVFPVNVTIPLSVTPNTYYPAETFPVNGMHTSCQNIISQNGQFARMFFPRQNVFLLYKIPEFIRIARTYKRL